MRKTQPKTNQTRFETTRTPTGQEISPHPQKARLFHSFHINHIKYAGTRFHTSEVCFPNHFLQPNNRGTIVKCITHWILNILKTSLHKILAISQWSKRWFAASPLLVKNYLILSVITPLAPRHLRINMIKKKKIHKLQLPIMKISVELQILTPNHLVDNPTQ